MSDERDSRREQEDQSRGILSTDVPPWLARLMTGLFLAGIFSVPLLQVLAEWRKGGPFQELELFTRRPSAANLHRYEKDLDRNSVARRAVQPRLQLALSRGLEFGNTNALVGRNGWLFYRPGVEFLTGPGLLDETRLRLRRKELLEQGEKNPAPDPRPALLAFHEACRQAGARLVLLPVPDKAMLQPGELTVRLSPRTACAPPANVDYPRFLQEMRDAGVDVFDPTPGRLVPGETPRFLAQDTHWTPAWMEAVARDLAAHLRREAALPPAGSRPWQAGEATVSRVGDIVDMLELPAGQTLFRPQAVTVRPVRDPSTGEPWRPREGADVLLLGDSFSNIYNAAEMGWGEGAGFPAQLARYLGRDLDVIARNGSAANGTRRELARREAPLGGKRVVVWQFAVRELLQGNWEVVPLPPARPGANPSPSPSPEVPLLVEGTVRAVSRVPRPFSVPYKNCLTYVKVQIDRVLKGDYRDAQVIAVMWGMKDNVLLPAAGYNPGKRLRLRLVPLRQAALDMQTVRSVDDLDDYEHRPYLVVQEQEL